MWYYLYMQHDHGVISLRTVIYAILFSVLLLGVYYMRNLVYVLLTSIVIASFVDSGVQRLKRYRVNRTISVILIYSLALSILGTFLYYFVPIFVSQLGQFSTILATYLPDTDSLHISSGLFSGIFANFEALTQQAGKGVAQVAISLFGGVMNLVILIVISFYLSINKRGIETFLRIVTPQPQEEYVVGLWKRTNRKIGLWFQGQLLLALLVGVLTYLGLLILNVQYSLLLALAAAIMELIPFGIILAAIPAIVSGYTTDGTTGAIQVAALYTIIQQFESNLIQPLVVQKVVGVSSLVVILALLVGIQLAGFWGVILAIPVAVLLMEIVGDAERKREVELQKEEAIC